MKKQFLIACTFIIAFTAWIVQADSNPMVSRVYGNQYTPAVADSQSAAAVGSLDTLFATNGSLSLNNIISGGQATGVETLPNGNFLVVVSDPTNTQASRVVQYNAQGAVQSFYGSSTGVALGTAATSKSPLATMIDQQGRLLVAGGATTGSAGWIYRISTTGTATAFTTGTSFRYVGGLAQQTSGKIIAAGFNGTNAMVARYNLDGTVDASFGSSGYVTLNGANGLPTSINGLYSVIVDSNNKIYIMCITGQSNMNMMQINADGSFTAGHIYSLNFLVDVSASSAKLAFDQIGNIILAGSDGSAMYVTALTKSGGPVNGFTDYESAAFSSVNMKSLITSTGSTNGYIYLIGSNTDTNNMLVIRLTYLGNLDTTFNSPNGYIEFHPAGSPSASYITAAGIAPDGQLYLPGYQTVSGTTTPYISRVNNTLYVNEIAQYPLAQEQGILDQTFGTTTYETYAGVVSPFNGLYGSILMQKPQSVIEITTTSGAGVGVPAIGDILVGMNGFTNSSANSNMMFAWLTAAGVVDTSVNSSGYLTLGRDTATFGSNSNETLTQVMQGPAGAIFVSGYATGGTSTGAFLRAYTTSSTSTWTNGVAAFNESQATAGWQGIGVGYQSLTGNILLFVAESPTVGHITAYGSGGGLTTFGPNSNGTIPSTYTYSVGTTLNMGPCYGGLINSAGNLIVAYKDTSDGYIKVACFNATASNLVAGFGNAGVTVPLFAGATGVNARNIRVCFNPDGDIIVTAINSSETSILVTLLDQETGQVDTAFAGGLGYLTEPVSGTTSLQLTNIVGVSNTAVGADDGTTVISMYDNATDDTMYLARVTFAGALDTTFNSQGSQPGILPIQIGDRVADYYARVATSALVQSTAGVNQGNIVISAYEQVTSSDVTPMIMRSYGQSSTTEILPYPITNTTQPGTFAAAYDLAQLLGTGAADVVFVYPGGNTYQSKILVGIDNGSTSVIARIDLSTQSLDTTFNGSGVYTFPGSLTGISTLSIDVNNNILVGGTSGSGPWAQLLTPDATGAVVFAIPAGVTAVNQISQQTSGRYILAGNTSGNGVLVAFQSQLVSPSVFLQVDSTFNPEGLGTTAGSYLVGTTGLYSIAINTDDTILAVYKDGVTNYLTVANITADGSGLVSTFNSGAVLSVTGITPDASSVCRVGISSNSGNIVIGASTGTGSDVKIQRFTATGAADTTWNGSGITANGPQTISNLGSAGITLRDLMETSANQTVFLGFNTSGGNGPIFAGRLASNGALDSTWNPSPTSPDTAGVLTFATNSVTQVNGSAISINGRIVVTGQQAGGTSGDPVVMAVYGDDYVTQFAQNPFAQPAGVLDTTIPGGSTGAWALSGTITGTPQKIAIYDNDSNGAVMLASTNGTDSYVTMLNADLSIGTYGSSGVATFTGQTSITDMYLTGNIASNTAAPILVTGTTAGAMWGANISANGTIITYLASSSGFTAGQVIRQTNNGRILVAGTDAAGSSAIAAFGSVTVGGVYPLDTSFGLNGVYSTGTTGSIYAMTVDSLDRIYIAYNNAGPILVQRLLANGTAVDSSFNATFASAINSYSASQIRMALDMTNEQLVVAAQDGTGTGNIIQVCRFNMNTGSATGTASAVTIAGQVLNVSDLFMDALQNIYIVGSTNSSNSIVARIASTSSTTIALDTSYAAGSVPAGIANLAAGSMSTVTAGAYNPDRRTYLVGLNGSNGYMARVYGDVYTSQVSQAITTATVGSLDTSLQPNNTGEIDLSAQAGWSTLSGGYIARAIEVNPNNNGTQFIAFGNGASVIVGCVDADMNPVTTFGGNNNGLTTAESMTYVNSLTIDAFGNVVVAGYNNGELRVLIFEVGTGALLGTAANGIGVVGTTIVQQKSGRYIVGGNAVGTNAAAIFAFKNPSAINAGILPVDATFGPANSNGFYTVSSNGSVSVDDLCVDSDDNIYFVYRQSNIVCLGKLTANGSGLVNAQNSPAAFNSGAVVETDIVNANSSIPARVAINSDGNILVSGTDNSANTMVSLFDGTTGAQIGTTVTVLSGANAVITKLVGSDTRFYGVAYDTVVNVSVFSITGSGILDSGFGISGITTVTGAGVGSPVNAYGLSVQTDGKLVVVGSNLDGAGATADPILLRFFGYQYVPQDAQAPDLVAAGLLDTTLWPTTGAFLLDNTTDATFNSLISGYAVKRVYEAGNGIMTFVADNGTDTVLFQMLKDLTLNTTFNATGYRQFTGTFGDTKGMYVNSIGNFYICGNYNSASWTIGINSVGADLTPAFNASVSIDQAYAIDQQSKSRVIVSGLNGSNGALIGYRGNGALDTFFAGGIVDMGVPSAITSISIDSSDRIIAVSNNSGTVTLQRVASNGSSVTALNGGSAITGALGDARVVLDASGDIVVAAATNTGFVISSYNNDATGTDIGTTTVLAGADSVLSNMYATSDGKVTLVGYNTTTGQAIVARLSSNSSSLELDTTTFNSPTGYLVTTVGLMDQFFDAIIHADNRIMLVGSNSLAANPYMGRVFGYPYATYIPQGPIASTPGTLNPTFGTDGTVDLGVLNSMLANAQGIAILPINQINDGNYVALTNANFGANSVLAKMTANGVLDFNYNSGGLATTYAPLGVNTMLQDGAEQILLVGTDSGAGWLQRYTAAGQADASFGSSGLVSSVGTMANMAVEQTLGRLVIAGKGATYGTLFAYTSLNPLTGVAGTVDTTFNSTGSVPGQFILPINTNPIYSVIADTYDRLIFAVLNSSTDAVDLYRLTPTGEYDNTFGVNGTVLNVLTQTAGASSVRVAFDADGNIIVVANKFIGDGFSIAAYDNGISTNVGANGQSVFAQSDISGLLSPNITDLVTSTDGYIFVQGNQSSTNAVWVARLTNTGQLDSANFNPEGLDASGTPGAGIAGIFEYGPANGSSYVFSGLAVNEDATLGMLGYSVTGGSTYTPLLVSVYNDPYVAQESQSPNAKPVGTNDLTLGVSVTAATDLGITFFGSSSADAGSGQVARSLGLYDDNNFVVAIDGNTSAGAGNSSIMMNMFDNDGITNPEFGTAGQQTVLSLYQNQYVNDMLTFTTASNVTKAILAGYVSNSDLGSNDSLLLQYILTPGSQGLDTTFGGFDGNPLGVAFGDGQKLFSVAQQSTGRIVAAGLSQDNLGLLLGYTSAGKMDSSFANSGYQSVNTGSAGIYSHAIDTNNNIVFVYNNGSNAVAVARYLADGSALDSSFGTPTPLINGITGNTNMKVALNSSNQVYVAAGTSSDNTISAKIYSQNGGTAIASANIAGVDLGNASAVYTLGRLIVDQSGNAIIAAYDSNAQQVVIVRLTSSLALDTTFNGTGYITYQVAGGTTSQVVTDALIHPDGRIFISGSEE